LQREQLATTRNNFITTDFGNDVHNDMKLEVIKAETETISLLVHAQFVTS